VIVQVKFACDVAEGWRGLSDNKTAASKVHPLVVPTDVERVAKTAEMTFC
jgi:hypothetical protein